MIFKSIIDLGTGECLTTGYFTKLTLPSILYKTAVVVFCVVVCWGFFTFVPLSWGCFSCFISMVLDLWPIYTSASDAWETK